MKPINILIVEDKVLIAEGLAAMLRKNSMNVVGISPSGDIAVELALEHKPDLILMDIELDGKLDGIETASQIKGKLDCTIIYLSDYTDPKTVNRAKATHPANYLSKPFQENDLIRAIEIAFYNTNTEVQKKEKILDKHVFLKTSSQVFVRLSYDEILYLEADRAYCKIVTENKTFEMSSNMKKIHEQIDNKAFIKVGRSAVVNVTRITALNGNVLKLDDHEVQMSGEYREELMKHLNFLR